MPNPTPLTIQTTITSPISKAWEYWTNPAHVTKWNHASDDWHSPRAENDLRVGGKFVYRMEAKDGSVGFDFGGTYDDIQDLARIEYTMDDGRKVVTTFKKISENETEVIETFDPESENPLELQRDGWQTILNNFKRYVEENSKSELVGSEKFNTKTAREVTDALQDISQGKNLSPGFRSTIFPYD